MTPCRPPMRGTDYKIIIDERVYELYGLTKEEIKIVVRLRCEATSAKPAKKSRCTGGMR
jgi:hypothetical protein